MHPRTGRPSSRVKYALHCIATSFEIHSDCHNHTHTHTHTRTHALFSAAPLNSKFHFDGPINNTNTLGPAPPIVMAESGSSDLTSSPPELQPFLPPSPGSIRPGLLSFQVNPHALNPSYTLTGFQHTDSITRDVFWDPYFGKFIRIDGSQTSTISIQADYDYSGFEDLYGSNGQSRASASASSTCPRPEAVKRLCDYGVHLEWCGIGSPGLPLDDGHQQQQSSESALRATDALCGPRGQHIMVRMRAILDEFLQSNREHKQRNVIGNDKLPGPDADIMAFDLRCSPETTVNNKLDEKIGYLVNDVLSLCQKAARWKRDQLAQQQTQQQDYDWPVPLDEPLRLLPGSKASNGSPYDHADRRASIPDFVALSGNTEIGCCESKPRAIPSAAGKLVLAKYDPLTATMNTVLQRERSRGQLGHSSSADTTSPDIAWQDKLLLQITSQLFLRNVRSGILLGDYGKMLVHYQLLPIPNPDSSSSQRRRFYLSFSDAAVYTKVPLREFRPGSDDDPIIQAAQATLDASTARGDDSAHQLQFDCRPGIVWSIVLWILSAWDLHKQNLRPRELRLGAKVPDIAVAPTQASMSVQGRHQFNNDSHRRTEYGPSAPDIQDSTDQHLDDHQQQQEQLLVCPLPWDFGTYANIYRCLIDNRDKTSSSVETPVLVPFSRLQKEAMLIKVQRRPLTTTSSNENDIMDGLAPLNLMEQPEEDVLGSIKARAFNEEQALHTLSALQGTVVPKLLGTMAPESAPQSHSIKLVMEDAGHTLSSLLVPARRPIVRVWGNAIADELESAIMQCHALGVAHGDLSSNNVVVAWYPTSTKKETLDEDDQSLSRLDLEVVRDIANRRVQPSTIRALREESKITSPSPDPASVEANAFMRFRFSQNSLKKCQKLNEMKCSSASELHADSSISSNDNEANDSGSNSSRGVTSFTDSIASSRSVSGSSSSTGDPVKLRVVVIDWADAVLEQAVSFEYCKDRDMSKLIQIQARLRGAAQQRVDC
ncbi:unnamed protein product [Sympodiomycopsis kandeliae]